MKSLIRYSAVLLATTRRLSLQKKGIPAADGRCRLLRRSAGIVEH